MSNLTLDNITMEELNKRINDLRDILNEICSAEMDSTKVQEERLSTSRTLDELIVKYMKQLGN